MNEIRQAIESDDFLSYYRSRREQLALSDNECEGPTPARRPKGRQVLQLGDYKVVTSELGHRSIRQVSSGETMHSVTNPIEEARTLYV